MGGVGVIGMGLIGMTVGERSESAPMTVLAPATGEATGDSAGEVATTSWAPSFRPVVTASPPPPPFD